MAISSADAGTVMDMRRTTTMATMGTGTDLASACTLVVAVADGVVTVATLVVTVDKPRGPAFCRPFLFAISLENSGGSATLLRRQHSGSPKPLKLTLLRPIRHRVRSRQVGLLLGVFRASEWNSSRGRSLKLFQIAGRGAHQESVREASIPILVVRRAARSFFGVTKVDCLVLSSSGIHLQKGEPVPVWPKN